MTPTPELVARLLASPLEFRLALDLQEGPGWACQPWGEGYRWECFEDVLHVPGEGWVWFPCDSAAWPRAACKVMGDGWRWVLRDNGACIWGPDPAGTLDTLQICHADAPTCALDAMEWWAQQRGNEE